MNEEIEIKKFCVFCGNKPKDKSKEHIIPQWLIKLTGDPNRKINLGIDMSRSYENGKIKFREFAFKSFQFPACSSCNEKYSKLESKAKPAIEKILNHEFLLNKELNLILNWFDKIRIGLWLGAIQLERKISPVQPKFHINNRIAEKDRALFVYEMNDNWKGVQFVGFNAPGFLFSPSCFALCINNFYFFNVSSDFLFSRNIGFPFVRKQLYREEDDATISEFSKGLEKVKLPLIKGPFLLPSIEIYQPIIPQKLIVHKNIDENLWDTKYVKNNCMDFSKGLGHIFYRDGKELVLMDDELELCLSDNTIYERELFMDSIALQVFKKQLHFLKNLPSTENIPLEMKRNIRNTQNDVISMQKMFMELVKKAAANTRYKK